MVVVVLPLLALLAASALLFVVSSQNQAVTAQRNRSIAVRSAAGGLLGILIDAETGVRGYLATGDGRFLDPYNAAVPRLQAIQGKYQALSSAPWLRDRLPRIETLVGQELAGLAQLKDAGLGEPAAVRLQQLLADKATMDALRAELTAVEDSEATQLTRLQADERSADRTAQLLFAASVAIGVLGGLAGILLFTTGVERRVRVLQHNAEALEQGFAPRDLGFGDDEIGRLGVGLQRAGELLTARAASAMEASRLKSEFLANMATRSEPR